MHGNNEGRSGPHRVLRWVPLVALLVGGCNDSRGGFGGGASGELGYANFGWRCAGTGDLACEITTAFVDRVAVGGTYALRYSLADRVPGEVKVGPIELATDRHTRVHGDDRFFAEQPARVNLMALSRDGEVVDYTTIEQREVDDLQLRDADSPAFPEQCDADDDCEVVSLRFVIGQTTEVRVEPLDTDGRALLGDLDYQWSVSPSNVAQLVSDSGNSARIRAEGGGVLEVTVTVEDSLTRTFHYRTDSDAEGPRRTKPMPDDTDGATDSDTGTGSDTGGDFGTDTGSGSGGGEGTGDGTTEAGSSGSDGGGR